jgi:Spy/CpxP family protein refolding chaperone
MGPGFIHWWREAHRHAHDHHHGHHGRHGCGSRGGPHRRPPDAEAHFGPGGEDGGGFGVRRPLRFMAWKLELSEEQVEKLAAILDGLKTERAQAAVDHRRSVGAFADAIGGEAFDAAAVTAAADARVQSADRLKTAVVDALRRTHEMLNADQRKQLAYLLRSGQLTI